MQTSLDLAIRNSLRPRLSAAMTLAATMPSPPYYCDVGVSGGIDNVLVESLRQQGKIRVIGCEPDEAECRRLGQAHPDDIYLPFIIGDRDGVQDLHVTRLRACSSCLRPDASYLATTSYAELFQVESIVRLPMRRFDSLIADGVAPKPDFLKLDVQGYELAVLRGFGGDLDHVLGVRLETHVRPLYEKQPLFPEILDYMVSRGFLLRDLRLTFPHDYEAVEFEAYFSRHPQRAASRTAALKLWELMHDIPPGRSVSVAPTGQVIWRNVVG